MVAIKFRKPNKKILNRLFYAIENNFGKDINTFFAPSFFAYFKKNISRKFGLNSYCNLYLAEEDKTIIGFAFLTFLKWDSNIFGFKIGRIENISMRMSNSLKRRFLNNIMQDCIKERYRHIHCRIGLDDFTTLNLLERLKFGVVDTQITLATSKKFRGPDVKIPRCFLLKRAKRGYLKYIKKISRGLFTDTRFTVDHNYPSDKVNKLYFEWIKNSIFDPRQHVFIIQDRQNNSVAGFTICNFDQNSKETLGIRIGYIDLIAVDKEYRNRGIGKILIKFALRWFSSRVDQVEIRTQASNIPAIRCFMNGGFNEFTSGIALPAGISLHRWF